MAISPDQLQSLARSLAHMKTVYPVGSRPPLARQMFFMALLATATMVFLAPTRHLADPHAATVQSETSAESVAISPPPAPPVPPSPAPAPRAALAPQPAPPSNSMDMAKTIDQIVPGSVVELGTMDSQMQEDFKGFLVRVAQAMDAFTAATGHEVCGVLMESDKGDAWRARLTTNRSHIGCVMVSFDDPGFHRMGDDIHSHPRLVGGVAANAQDVDRRPDFRCGQKIVVFDETFSGADLARGPGYLVSRNQLLYQHGADKPFRQLAVFPSLEGMPELDTTHLTPAIAQVSPQEAAAAAWAGREIDGIPATHCPDKNAPVSPIFGHP